MSVASSTKMTPTSQNKKQPGAKNIAGQNNSVKKKWQQRFWQWADRRATQSNTHTLNRNNLYIFPSRQGFAYLFVVVLLWLLGTNFENNLVLALAFLMTTLFVVTILHTFANLSGIKIQLLDVKSAFKGERVEIPFEISCNGQRHREQISIRFEKAEYPVVIDKVSENKQIASCFIAAERRGRIATGRLYLETHFPLGIIRCWSRLKVNADGIVYPQPLPAGPFPSHSVGEGDGESGTKPGGDEFSGYRDFREGDSLKHFAWKHYARGAGELVKEFSGQTDSRCWFSWEDTTANNVEDRLSQLCDWVIRADQAQREFGLLIPGIKIEPSSGAQHRAACLKVLALYGLPEEGVS